MTPSPERFVSLLAAAGVRRLLAVRAVPPEPEFLRRAAEAGEKAGVAIEAEFAWPRGGRSIYFRDPSGNSLEFANPSIWGF